MSFSNKDSIILPWVVKNLRKAELFSLIIFSAALALKSSLLPGGNILLTLTLSSLAVLYFFSAFQYLDDPNKKQSFCMKLLGYGWAMAIVGINFILQGWPGSESMIGVAMIILVSVSAFLFYLKSKNNEDYPAATKTVLFRTLVIVVLAMALRYGNKEELIRSHIISVIPPTEQK